MKQLKICNVNVDNQKQQKNCHQQEKHDAVISHKNKAMSGVRSFKKQNKILEIFDFLPTQPKALMFDEENQPFFYGS